MFWITAALTLFGQANRGGTTRTLPILTALDADGNGEISDTEIMDSAAALRKLDKNKDGKLTPDELRPSLLPTGMAKMAIEEFRIVPQSPSPKNHFPL